MKKVAALLSTSLLAMTLYGVALADTSIWVPLTRDRGEYFRNSTNTLSLPPSCAGIRWIIDTPAAASATFGVGFVLPGGGDNTIIYLNLRNNTVTARPFQPVNLYIGGVRSPVPFTLHVECAS